MRQRLGRRSMAILFNAVLPVVVSQLLLRRGVAFVPALAATALIPLLRVAWVWLRRRRLEALAVASLVIILVTLLLSILSGNPRFLLARPAVVAAVAAVAAFVSMRLPLPLAYYVGHRIAKFLGPTHAEQFAAEWSTAPSLSILRVVTLVWACGLALEAAARLTLVLTLPPAAALSASRLAALGPTLVLAAWSLIYLRRKVPPTWRATQSE